MAKPKGSNRGKGMRNALYQKSADALASGAIAGKPLDQRVSPEFGGKGKKARKSKKG